MPTENNSEVIATEIDYSETPVSIANLKAYLQIDGGLSDYKPDNVTNVVSTPAHGQVTLSWTNPINYAQDSSLNATFDYIKIYKSTDGGSTYSASVANITDSNTTTATITKLIDYETVYFKIVVFNNFGVQSTGTIIQTAAGYDDTYKPATVTTIAVKKGNAKNTITWTDVTYGTDGNAHSDVSWANAKLIYKIGSAPTSIEDGEVLITEETKDQYAFIGYVHSGLTNGTTYYYAVYTTNSVGKTSDLSAVVSATPQATRTMTVRIDTTDSNPDTCCTYEDDATSMTAKSDDWDEFFGHYPVLLTATGEETKLNPNNFAQTESGANADITSGFTGDVMICFPRRDIKIEKSGNYIYVSMTDDLGATDYTHYAHKKGSSDVNKFYYAVYDACNLSNVGRSLSEKTPWVSISLTNARSATTSRSNWYLAGFYQRLYIQVMFILKYKSLNGQTALGRGYVDDSGYNKYKTTGKTDALGMDYGSTSTGTNETTNRMKIFGIEDFWGNIYQWMDGCFYNSSTNLLTSYDPANFNNTGNNYINVSNGSLTGNWLVNVIGTSEAGFCPGTTNTGGSETTYFSDYWPSNASSCLRVGGSWANTGFAGPFFVGNAPVSDTSAYAGFRIMYIA